MMEETVKGPAENLTCGFQLDFRVKKGYRIAKFPALQRKEDPHVHESAL